MITVIYRIIVVYITLMIIYDIWEEVDYWKQLTAAIVIIPFILRILMIK